MHKIAWDDGATAQKILKRKLVISAQSSDLQRPL